MVINSKLNYWLTSTHHKEIDAEGMYLPASTDTNVSDELGSYLLTLEGVVEVKQVKEKQKP
jgi:hypothetical protein